MIFWCFFNAYYIAISNDWVQYAGSCTLYHASLCHTEDYNKNNNEGKYVDKCDSTHRPSITICLFTFGTRLQKKTGNYFVLTP